MVHSNLCYEFLKILRQLVSTLFQNDITINKILNITVDFKNYLANFGRIVIQTRINTQVALKVWKYWVNHGTNK